MAVSDRRRTGPGMAVLATGLSSALLLAAPARGAAPEAGPAAAGSETIIVTAQRRAQDIGRTPAAVSVVDADEIEARSAVNVADVVNAIPNAEFDTTAPISGSANTASIFIRGIGQTDFVFATDPGVLVSVDGVIIARATGSALQLLDVDRVEVLRGPQGTIAGRNAIGGAIALFTARPDPANTRASGEIALGADDLLELRGMANLALGGGAALRVAGLRRRQDGFARRVSGGERLGGEDGFLLRGGLLWEPDTRLSLRLGADYSHRDDDSPATSLVPVGSVAALGGPTTLFAGLLYNNLIRGADGLAPCQRPGFVVPFCGLPGLIQMPTLPADTVPFDGRWLTGSRDRTFATGPTGSHFDGWGTNGTIEWKGSVTLRSITAYRRFHSEFGRDPDSSPLVIVDTSNRLRHRQFSQELQANGGEEDDAFNWVAGFYYFDEHGSDRVTAPLIDEPFRLLARLGLGCTLLPGATGLPAPVFVSPCPNIFRIDSSGMGTRIDNDSIAAFGEATLRLNPWLTVTGGIRWTRDRKRIDISGFLTGGQPASPNPVAQRSFERVTPRVIVQADLSKGLMAYGSWSTGYKSGGFNQRYGAPIAAPTAFDPETVSGFEAGLRAKLPRRASVRATAFWSDYHDIQAVVFDNGIPRTINAAQGRSRGVEIETSWPLGPLTLQASYGYLDTRYTRLDPAIIGSFGTPIVNPLRLDMHFVNAPRHSLAASADWTRKIEGLGELRLRGDVSYRTRTANDATNTPELIAPPVTLVNARISLARGAWKASLFGTNLLDERYPVSGAADPAGFGAAEYNVSAPRRWGAALELSW